MANRPLYALGRLFIQAYASLMLRLHIRSHGPLPSGPAVYAANHPSATDPFLIHLVSQQPLSVLITSSAFAIPVLGSFLRRMEQVEVDRAQASLAYEQALQALRDGRSVGIFPEGDFSPQEGGFRPPRSGAARLALEAGVPIVPVGIYLPRERSLRIASKVSGKPAVGYWYLRGPYHITVGEALRFEGDVNDRMQVGLVSARIMERIHELSEESRQRQTGLGARPLAAWK